MPEEKDSRSSEPKKGSDLQTLSTILVKQRSAEDLVKVEKILALDKEVAEKIRLIQNLDNEVRKVSNQSESAPPPPQQQQQQKTQKSDEAKEAPVQSGNIPQPLKKTAAPKPESEYAVDTVSPKAAIEVANNRHRISQNRKVLKPLIGYKPFFRFLFYERKKIKIFAMETGTIRLKSFGTKPFLNPGISENFSKNICNIAGQLMKPLKIVLDKGWYYLEKRDYNLVALLYKLCREITLVDFEKFNKTSIDLIDRMASVELLFLILKYEPGDVRALIFAVEIVLGKDPSKSEILRETAVNIHKLLDKDQLRPSLQNFIIGLNIIKTRTYLELENLMNPSLQLIDSHDYNCTPQVRDKIDDCLRKLEKGIPNILKHEKEVYRLHAFIPTDRDGVIDHSLLKDFYDGVLSTRNLSFEYNKKNIIKFILNLGNAFLISFKDILSETIKPEEGEQISLFSHAIFGQDLLRIEFNLGKLDKIQTIMPKFATSRCLSIKKTISGAIDSEADAIHVIDEITGTLVAMGKRLAHILRCALPRDSESYSDTEIPYFSFSENTYSIPYENQKIDSDGYIKGFTVRDALFKIAGICYQTGAFVQHSELTNLLAREKKIHDDLHIRTRHYKRIAHERVYAAFLEKYDIPV